MLILLFSPLSILSAGIVTFMFGWLWYSPYLMMNWWLDGMHIQKENMPVRTPSYSRKVMTYTFFICTIMCAVLAYVIDTMGLTTFTQAISLSVLLALGFIGLKNFSDMLYTMTDTFWSIRAQKKFFVDTAYYVCMFAIATTVMYYVQTSFGA